MGAEQVRRFVPWLVAATLVGEYHLSRDATASLLNSVLGVPICAATVQNCCAQVSAALSDGLASPRPTSPKSASFASPLSSRSTFASSGDRMPPCGVPPSVRRKVPSVRTPAFKTATSTRFTFASRTRRRTRSIRP